MYIKREDAINALAISQDFSGINAEKLNNLLFAIPSADVVEVVRCRDCKYQKPNKYNDRLHCRAHYRSVCDNDYCSYGQI